MQIQNVPITSVKPYEKNPRFNDDAVDAVAKSIKEFGWQQPIVIDSEMVVIAGHTRLKAAERLGLTEVPVIVADNLTPEQVKAYRIADNKTGELAEWNYDLLPERGIRPVLPIGHCSAKCPPIYCCRRSLPRSPSFPHSPAPPACIAAPFSVPFSHLCSNA